MAIKKLYSYNDLMKMSIPELKKVKKLYRDDVTRNLRKLRKAGVKTTPATLGLQRALKSNAGFKPYNIDLGDLQSTPNKTKTPRPKFSPQQQRASLISEIAESQQFLTSKTGTVKGYKQVESNMDTRLGGAYSNAGVDVKRKFWELYEEQREFIEENALDSDEIQKALANYFAGANGKRITQKRRDWFKKLVEDAYDAAGGISGDTTVSPFNI